MGGIKRKSIKNMLFKSTLVFVGVIAAVLIVEISLRGTPYDKRVPFFPFKESPRYMYDEYSGYDILPNLPRSGSANVGTNQLGCVDLPYNGEKNPILLVGDSFTEASFVPFEDTWGTILEKLLQIRVLKCGVAAYGPKQEYHKMTKVINQLPTNPSIIILGYFTENDFSNDYCFPEYTFIDGYLAQKCIFKDIPSGQIYRFSDDELREKINKNIKNIDFKTKLKYWLMRNSIISIYLSEFQPVMLIAYWIGFINTPVKLAPSFLLDHTYPWLKDAWQKHINNLKDFKSFADRIGSKLLILIFPSKEQVYSFLRPPYKGYDVDWDHPNKKILKMCKENEIICFDLTPHFREYADQTPRRFLDHKKDLYFQNDGHWNTKGNHLAGLLIARYIIENELVEVKDRKNKITEIEEQLKILIR